MWDEAQKKKCAPGKQKKDCKMVNTRRKTGGEGKRVTALQALTRRGKAYPKKRSKSKKEINV